MSPAWLPYGDEVTWNYRDRRSHLEIRGVRLQLMYIFDGSPLSDGYTPEEISAGELWRRWVDEHAAPAADKDPDILALGEVRIAWFVADAVTDSFEAAPFLPPKWGSGEHFLRLYTHPVNSVTGEPLNFLRLPVQDYAWEPGRGDKGGFVQQLLGWKPAPLTPKVNVRQLADAANLYWPR